MVRVWLAVFVSEAVFVRVLDSDGVSLLDGDAERVSDAAAPTRDIDDVYDALLLLVGVLDSIIDGVVLRERDTDPETVFVTVRDADKLLDCEQRNPTHDLEGVFDIADIFVAVAVCVRVIVRDVDGVREVLIDTDGVAGKDLDADRLDPVDIEVDGEGILDILGDADTLLDCEQRKPTQEVDALAENQVPDTVRLLDTLLVMDFVGVSLPDCDRLSPYETDGEVDGVGIRDRVADAVRLFDCEQRNPTHELDGVFDTPDIFVAVVVCVRVIVRDIDGVREVLIETDGVAGKDLDADRLDPFDIEVDGEGILDTLRDADTLLDCEQRNPTQEADALAENQVPDTVRLLDTLRDCDRLTDTDLLLL